MNFEYFRYLLRMNVSNAIHCSGLPTMTHFMADFGWPNPQGWQIFMWDESERFSREGKS